MPVGHTHRPYRQTKFVEVVEHRTSVEAERRMQVWRTHLLSSWRTHWRAGNRLLMMIEKMMSVVAVVVVASEVEVALVECASEAEEKELPGMACQ